MKLLENSTDAVSNRALTGRLWELAQKATTPLVPADYLDMVAPLRGGADLRARVQQVRVETRDAVTLVLKPGASWRGHLPGQYVRIGIDIDGVRQWRAYSLTSQRGRADDCISITVKAIPDGRVSNYLVNRAKPGQLIHLDQAAGDFTLPQTPPGKTLFVTAGSGITPVMGILRNALPQLPDVTVVHSAPTHDDVIFGVELRQLAASGRIRLVEQHTDVDGMLTVEDLDALVPDLTERHTWACGPTGLLDALDGHWEQLGVVDQLHTERFRPRVVTPGDGGTVRFAKSGNEVQASGETTLLDVGEEAGVLMPSGCRMGICFGCVVPLREGAVRDLRNGDLTTAAPGDGVRIQTCISAAAGSCDIDI